MTNCCQTFGVDVIISYPKMFYLSGFCSLCLVGTQNLKNILSIDSDGLVVQEKIKIFLLELVNFRPNVLKYVCSSCLEHVNNIHSFRLKCLKNITTLKECVLKFEGHNELTKNLPVSLPAAKYDPLKPANQINSQSIVKENDLLIKQETKEIPNDFQNTEGSSLVDNVSPEQVQENIFNTFQSPYIAFKKFQEYKQMMEQNKNTSSSNNISHNLETPVVPVPIPEEKSIHIVEPDINSILQATECDSDSNDDSLPSNSSSWNCNSNSTNPTPATATAKRNSKKKYKCTECFKDFLSPSHLETHYRVHTGIRPYSCPTCHKTFNQSNDLKRHARVHTGEKPFACEVCGKTFKQLIHLKEHSRIHSNTRPYKCVLCDKAFTQGGNLTMHMRTHR